MVVGADSNHTAAAVSCVGKELWGLERRLSRGSSLWHFALCIPSTVQPAPLILVCKHKFASVLSERTWIAAHMYLPHTGDLITLLTCGNFTIDLVGLLLPNKRRRQRAAWCMEEVWNLDRLREFHVSRVAQLSVFEEIRDLLYFHEDVRDVGNQLGEGLKMGQQQTKQRIEKGVKLYEAKKSEAAVHEWKRVLSKVKDSKSRFVVLGHLAHVYGEWGFAREMMHYAVQQMDIASELESDELKSESYLNLAKSNERLCEYHKSLSYARHSLASAITAGDDPSKLGYIYLSLAASNLGFSSFKDSLENLEKAVKMAIEAEDQMLECEVYGCLGNVYKCLKDYDRALKFYVRARELIRCRGQEWPPRLKIHAYVNMAAVYRSMRKLDMAMDSGEVSTLDTSATRRQGVKF